MDTTTLIQDNNNKYEINKNIINEHEDHKVPAKLYYIALNYLGIYYDKLRKNDLAEECYLKASKCLPIALFNHAALLIQHNKYKLYTSGATEESEKRFDEIKKLMEKYIEIYPSDPDSYYELSSFYIWKDKPEIRYGYLQKSFNLGKLTCGQELIYYYAEQINKSHSTYYNTNVILINNIIGKIYDEIIWFEDNKNNLNPSIDSCDWKYIYTDKEVATSWTHLQKQMNPNFINIIGVMYSSGSNYVKKDNKKAYQLWNIVLLNTTIDNQSHIIATYNLGLSYKIGDGCTKDLHKAFEYFKKCDTDCDAQYEIGTFYEHGYIPEIPKDLDKAKEWYLKAANNPKECDYNSCIKLVKNDGFNISLKDKTHYYLKAAKSIEYKTNYSIIPIPKEVLCYLDKKLKKQKQKIVELECRPPIKGGKLYLQVLDHFNNIISSENTN